MLRINEPGIGEEFRRLLVSERAKAGISQAELARRLGVPQSVISKIESGVRGLEVPELIGVAKAIGFDPAELIRKLDQSRGDTH